jgi:hypothetical protein
MAGGFLNTENGTLPTEHFNLLVASETVGGTTTKYLVATLNPTGLPQVIDELVSGAVTRTYAYGLQRISENQKIGTTAQMPDLLRSSSPKVTRAGIVVRQLAGAKCLGTNLKQTTETAPTIPELARSLRGCDNVLRHGRLP